MEEQKNNKLKSHAAELRKNMTKEERHLWYNFLRNYPVNFKRQKIIGNYIVDFYCAKKRLIIELDGSQHYNDEGLERDNERTAYLNSHGYKVVRILNRDINTKFKDVCIYIDSLFDDDLK